MNVLKVENVIRKVKAQYHLNRDYYKNKEEKYNKYRGNINPLHSTYKFRNLRNSQININN